MPTCCIDDQQVSFANVSQTVIPTERMRPIVDVMYYDAELDKWFPGGFLTDISIIPGTSITVQHGGPSTGVVKIKGV